MQRGPSDSMSPCSHLGPKPRLGYTASLIERAVETRADAAGVVQTRSHHRGGHWELQSLCSAPFLYPFPQCVGRFSLCTRDSLPPLRAPALQLDLRKAAERTIPGLCRRIGRFACTLSPREARNYFRQRVIGEFERNLL